MSDLIDRKQAIDAIVNRTVTVDTDAQWLSGHARCELEIIDIINALPSAQPEPCEDAVSREAAIKCCTFGRTSLGLIDELRRLPSVTLKPEQPEVLSDGTLHIAVDLDISKVDRILLSQKGTHYGNLFYVDDDEPKRKTGKWISCSERLPERGEDVLVTRDYDGREDHNKSCRYVEVASCYGDDDDILWSSYSDEYKMTPKNHHVIAWMPLPEPYKERREG